MGDQINIAPEKALKLKVETKFSTIIWQIKNYGLVLQRGSRWGYVEGLFR